MTVVSELFDVWRDFVALTDQSSVDESQFHVYRDLLFYLLRQLEQDFFSDNNISETDEWQMLQRSTESFSSTITLNTGSSMEVIWKALRPTVSKSIEGFSQYARLAQMIVELDTISKQTDFGNF